MERVVVACTTCTYGRLTSAPMSSAREGGIYAACASVLEISHVHRLNAIDEHAGLVRH